MQRLARSATSLMIILWIFGFSPLQAQTDDTCYGLSRTDCRLYYNALGNTANNFTIDYELNLSLIDLNINELDLTGSLQFSLDSELQQSFFSNNLDAADYENMQEFFSFIIDGIFTPLLVYNETQIRYRNADGRGRETLEFILDDGIFYFYVSDMAVDSWAYIDISDIFFDLIGAQLDAIQGQGGNISGSSTTGTDSLEFFQNIINTPGVVTGDASNDEAIDGQRMRRITLDFDLEALLTSEAANPFMEQVVIGAFPDEDLTEVELKQYVEIFKGLFVPYVENSDFTFSWIIGVRDERIHGLEMTFDLTVDEDFATQQMNFQSGLEIELSVVTRFSEFDESFTVTPPEDAFNFGPLFRTIILGQQ